jgi:hypothetical protein
MSAAMAAGAMAQAAGSIGVFAGSLMAKVDKEAKVDVPEIDLSGIQQETAAGNLAVMPQAQKFAQALNLFTTGQWKAMFDLALPGQREKATSNINDLLSGKIPKDMMTSIMSSGAARMLQRFGGLSEAGLKDTLGLVGQTSYGMAQQGFNNLMTLAGTLPQQLNPMGTGLFLTAGQRVQVAQSNQALEYQNRLRNATLDAQPSGTMAAIGNALMASGSTLAGAGATGAFGGGGGGSAWGGGGSSAPLWNQSGMTMAGWDSGMGGPSWGDYGGGLGAAPSAGSFSPWGS